MYNVEVFALLSLALEYGRVRHIRSVFPASSLDVALSLPTWFRVYSESGLIARRAIF